MSDTKQPLLYLIEILHQTTTGQLSRFQTSKLYLIEILHQTTTTLIIFTIQVPLYLIEILHQTTTIPPYPVERRSCILSKFYIKPQLRLERELARCSCILSKFYIKPQRNRRRNNAQPSCILSKFYIKPQRRPHLHVFSVVVSYRNSTSNHNVGPHID